MTMSRNTDGAMSVMIPGYGGHRDPVRADPNKLRRLAQAGLGEHAEVARRARDMFRTDDPDARPLPHIIDVTDVTKGLGLDAEYAGRIQKIISEARVDWGRSPYDRSVPQIHANMVRLSTVLMKMPIDSHVRVELRRRAYAYWKRDYAFNQREPQMGFRISKSQLSKAFPPKKGPQAKPGAEAEEHPELSSMGAPAGKPQTPGGQRPGLPQALASQGRSGPGAQPSNPHAPMERGGTGKGAPQQGGKGAQGAAGAGAKKPGKHTTPMQSSDADGGQVVDFGHGVSSAIPADGDYHYHAKQYALHTAGYETNKDSNPKVAEAHRHAANMHGRIANALHSAGQTDRHPATVPQPDPMAGQPGAPMDPFADPMDRAGPITDDGTFIDEDGDGVDDREEGDEAETSPEADTEGLPDDQSADAEGNPIPSAGRPMLGKAPAAPQAGVQAPAQGQAPGRQPRPQGGAPQPALPARPAGATPPPRAGGPAKPAVKPAAGAPGFGSAPRKPVKEPPKKPAGIFGKSESAAQPDASRSRFFFRRG